MENKYFVFLYNLYPNVRRCFNRNTCPLPLPGFRWKLECPKKISYILPWILGFRRGWTEFFRLLGYYAAKFV